MILAAVTPCQADQCYCVTKDIKVENDELIVEHHHDWSPSTASSRRTMKDTHQDPFRSDNNYAYIRCTDKRTGKVLWQRPTPALTALWISPDGGIIGYSNIMVLNPYQLVIFDRSGDLLLKKHIASQEAGITTEEFSAFNQKFPEAMQHLREFTFKRNDSMYIDFLRRGMPDSLGNKAWRYLFDYVRDSPYSPNFSESVTNWVFWFDESDPSPQLRFVDGTLAAISLRDPKGVRFEIPVQ
jgi:hypothetical protein